jgi:hypothetical protein
MLSMQLQARPPVRFSRLSHTALASAAALAGFSPLSQAAFFEDSTATFETRNMYFNRDFRDGSSSRTVTKAKSGSATPRSNTSYKAAP